MPKEFVLRSGLRAVTVTVHVLEEALFALVILRGVVTPSKADAFRDKLSEALCAFPAASVVMLDVSGLWFEGLGGLEPLLGEAEAARARGLVIRWHGLHPPAANKSARGPRRSTRVQVENTSPS